jgi:hypothetical protein
MEFALRSGEAASMRKMVYEWCEEQERFFDRTNVDAIISHDKELDMSTVTIFWIVKDVPLTDTEERDVIRCTTNVELMQLCKEHLLIELSETVVL